MLKRFLTYSENIATAFWQGFQFNASIYIDAEIIMGVKPNHNIFENLKPYCDVFIPRNATHKLVFRMLAKVKNLKDILEIFQICKNNYDEVFIFMHTSDYECSLDNYKKMLKDLVKRSRLSILFPAFYTTITSSTYYTDEVENIFKDFKLVMTYYTSKDFEGEHIVLNCNNYNSDRIINHINGVGFDEKEFTLVKGSYIDRLKVLMSRSISNFVNTVKNSWTSRSDK